ncbi:hypothetical protein ABZ949_05340 [Micromonospora tulbaghiae]|uniref:hypothetical protein n=1 Tax=Micromonospora tulbaghiae TaxID=479978 RepID=UPI00340AA74A
MIDAIAAAVVAAGPQVAGLAVVVALVAVLAYAGHRQEQQRVQAAAGRARAAAGRARAGWGWLVPAEVPAVAGLPPAVDPWPDAERDEQLGAALWAQLGSGVQPERGAPRTRVGVRGARGAAQVPGGRPGQRGYPSALRPGDHLGDRRLPPGPPVWHVRCRPYPPG